MTQAHTADSDNPEAYERLFHLSEVLTLNLSLSFHE